MSAVCERIAAAYANGPAAIHEVASGRAIEMSRLLAEASELSDQLVARDLTGERLLIAIEPGIDWVRVFLATLAAGAIAVPVPLSAPPAELAYFASDSRARAVFAGDSLRDRLPRELETLPLSATEVARHVRGKRSEASPALILYTSGTTGRPKGAVITHQNLLVQTSALREAWAISHEDVLLHALPLHHLHGVVVALLSALTAGATVRMLPKFDAELWLRELSAVTLVMAVPTMIQKILERVEALSIGDRERASASARSLRLFTSGSAALPTSLAERFRAFAGSIPLERYGMTEIGIALSNPLEAARRKPGFVGSAIANIEHRIVHDDGESGDGPGDPKPPPNASATAGSSPATLPFATPTATCDCSAARAQTS